MVGVLLELVMQYAVAALWIRFDGTEAVVALLVALGALGPCGPALRLTDVTFRLTTL